MTKYVGNAHPGDRFIGLNCGCVVIVRNTEIAASLFNLSHRPQSEWAFRHSEDQSNKYDMPTERITDFIVANVYYECQQILQPHATGIRWQ